jgi:hypothetical protein
MPSVCVQSILWELSEDGSERELLQLLRSCYENNRKSERLRSELTTRRRRKGLFVARRLSIANVILSEARLNALSRPARHNKILIS